MDLDSRFSFVDYNIGDYLCTRIYFETPSFVYEKDGLVISKYKSNFNNTVDCKCCACLRPAFRLEIFFVAYQRMK